LGQLELETKTTNTAAYPADATIISWFEAFDPSEMIPKKMIIQSETVIR